MAYYILLDRRIILEQPQITGAKDSWNQKIEIHGEPILHKTWAMRRDMSARERISGQGDEVLSSLRTRFTIRYRNDVNAKWRVRDGSEVFGVEGVREIGRRKYTELICSSHEGGA